MVNEFKNILLAGVGAAAYTYEKASKLVDEMVQKGKLTVEEGKELSEELKRNVGFKQETPTPITKEEMTQLLKDMNFVTKDEVAEIKERLSKLENINNIQK